VVVSSREDRPIGVVASFMKAWVAAALLALSSVGKLASARAQSEPPSHLGADSFGEQDNNGDARVTLPEARGAALGFFAYLDVNADGWVTRDELMARAPRWRQARSLTRFTLLDRDHDGSLASWETSFSPGQFARLDRDGDRRLSRGEWWEAHERGPHGAGDTAAWRSRFWRQDLNRDGLVTRDEVIAHADQRFMRRDSDRNGVLTRDERRAPHCR